MSHAFLRRLIPPVNPRPVRARVRTGLARHPFPRRSSYQQGRLFYHLSALERLGTLVDVQELAGHDWYGEGAIHLLSTQGPDGSWDDGADTPAENTCFALLFLTRATHFMTGP